MDKMDGNEGSSGAAQGALTGEDESRGGGFFRRIIGALSPADTGEGEEPS